MPIYGITLHRTVIHWYIHNSNQPPWPNPSSHLIFSVRPKHKPVPIRPQFSPLSTASTSRARPSRPRDSARHPSLFFPFCTPGSSLTDFWPPLGSIHPASPTRPSRHSQPACTVRPARVRHSEDPASTTHFGRPRRQELGTILSESTTTITIDIIPQARPHRHGSIHLPLSWDSLPTRFTASAPLPALPACQPARPPTTTSHIRNLPRPIHRIHFVPQPGRFSAHPSSAHCQTAQTASL